MKALSGLDGAFLDLETPATPMHVGSLHLVDVPKAYRRDFHARVKRWLADRMRAVPVFRRRLALMPLGFANPVWVDGPDVDLDLHVRRILLPAPGTQAQLEACVAALHAELLDRRQPLWMLYVIEGLATGQCACYVKIHHAELDGAAGMVLASTLFDAAPGSRRSGGAGAHAPRPAETPGAVRLAAAALRHDAAQYVALLRRLPDMARAVAGVVATSGRGRSSRARPASGFAPRTPLNVTITGERGFAAVSLPLAEIRTVAARHEATVNDVVLALCSGALRRYLTRHGGLPRKSLRALMPISLREPGNEEFTIKATLSLVGLASHLADPIRRLHAVRDAARSVKSVARRARNIIPTDFPTVGAPWLIGALASLYGSGRIADALPPIANVVISNVAGSTVPLYIAGARLASYWPLSIVEHGVGLNITVVSYAGKLGFGLTVARCAVPDADELVADLLAAHEELQRHASRVPTKRRTGVKDVRTTGRSRAPA